MGKLQAVEISEGARLAEAMLSAIGDVQRENDFAIEAATRRYVNYLCHVIRRVMQRWSNRPVSWVYDYECWTECEEDDAVKAVVEGAFSPLNSWKHIDAEGEFDLVATVLDDVWDSAVEVWRIKGSEAELTALHERIVHMMI